MKPFGEKFIPEISGTWIEWATNLRRHLMRSVLPAIVQMPFNRSETATASDSGTADTEFAVTHHLGRIPSGYIVTSIDKPGVVYAGSTAWTATEIYLKCSEANASIQLQVF